MCVPQSKLTAIEEPAGLVAAEVPVGNAAVAEVTKPEAVVATDGMALLPLPLLPACVPTASP